jgi:hypothetical protein
VVFNHTAEGNERGLTLSFRGLDNRMYYMLAPGGEYYNYSGCGNTFNCNHPVVRQFIVDCLRFWVTGGRCGHRCGGLAGSGLTCRKDGATCVYIPMAIVIGLD